MSSPEEELLKAVPLKEVYVDALQPAVQQVGKALESTVAAASFLLAPIEYIAAWRDRWGRYLKRISEKVPESNLIDGNPEVIGPTLLNLQFAAENDIRAEMFLNLLARAIDRERVSEAHPAYGQIISQLHPDEAIVLYELKRNSFLLTEQADLSDDRNGFKPRYEISNEFPVSKLAFHRNFRTYMDHLYHLGLAAITQQGNQEILRNEQGKQIGVHVRSRIGLLVFGQIFAKTCIPDEFKF